MVGTYEYFKHKGDQKHNDEDKQTTKSSTCT
jgi:hypothetical protein